jgi:hypothetical protein
MPPARGRFTRLQVAAATAVSGNAARGQGETLQVYLSTHFYPDRPPVHATCCTPGPRPNRPPRASLRPQTSHPGCLKTHCRVTGEKGRHMQAAETKVGAPAGRERGVGRPSTVNPARVPHCTISSRRASPLPKPRPVTTVTGAPPCSLSTSGWHGQASGSSR